MRPTPFQELSAKRLRPSAEPPAAACEPRLLRLPRFVALLAVALTALTAGAQEPEKPRFLFDAFGTIGGVYSTEDRADFVWLPTRPSGPGHSETLSLDPDSIFAGQATFRVSSKLTAVAQVVVEHTAADDYSPALEWANLRYDVTPDFSVRAGRFAVPGFLVSEYRKVSYANPWVRPPIEVYSLVPIFTMDGVEARRRWHAGEWTNTLGASLGRSETDLPGGGGKVIADDAWNVNATFQRGGLTTRAAVAGADLDIDAFDPLFTGFRAFGPEGAAIADRYEVDERSFLFASAGVELDPGRWFVMAEAGWLDTESVLGEKIAGYVSGGYRWRSLTPYATYSRVELLSESSAEGLATAGLPPQVVPVAAGLNAGLNGILGSAAEQQSLGLGGRWDFQTGLALKLQVDFIDTLGDSPGTFINEQPGFQRGGSAQVFSLATVFVF